MIYAILLVMSIAPVLVIGHYIYTKDKEKEPSSLLMKLFLGGIGSCFLVLLITWLLTLFIPFFGFERSTLNLFELFIQVFIGVALVEEFSKWVMAYTISYNDKAFDEFYDMLLYCMYVALGFACFENILYVLSGGVGTAIMRAVLAVPGHVCFGLFMGYYLGLAKISELNNRKDLKTRNTILSIVVPTIAHGFYDYCLMAEVLPLLAVFVVFVIAMYIYVILKIKKVSSLNRKMKYKDNFCTNCGHPVRSNFCPICGRKNE